MGKRYRQASNTDENALPDLLSRVDGYWQSVHDAMSKQTD